MAQQKFTNSALSKLASGITAAATSLTLATGDGAKFPVLGSGDWCMATLVKLVANLPVVEIVRVTARTGDTLTIVRAQEGTSATTFSTNDLVELRITAAMMNRAMGSYTGQRNTSGSNTLTSADVGILIAQSSGGTVQLPLSTDVEPGARVHILAVGAACSVAAQGGETLGTLDGTSGPITQASQSMGVYRRNLTTGSWTLEDGDAALAYAPSFQRVLTMAGYQKLPGGRIEVQGTFTASATPGAAVAVTFPLGAANFRNLVMTPVNSGTSAISAWWDTATGSGFNGHCSVASAIVHYRAVIDG